MHWQSPAYLPACLCVPNRCMLPPLPGWLAADADNAAAAAALSTGAVQVNAATGRWELPDPWMDAVAGVRLPAAARCACLSLLVGTLLHAPPLNHSHVSARLFAHLLDRVPACSPPTPACL